MHTDMHVHVHMYMWALRVKPDLARAWANLGVAMASQVRLFTETKKESPNTGARANNTLHE